MSLEPSSVVERWNAQYPEGTGVIYRSHPREHPVPTRTRSVAWVLGGHTPVVLVEKLSGCVALDALEVVANGEDGMKIFVAICDVCHSIAVIPDHQANAAIREHQARTDAKRPPHLLAGDCERVFDVVGKEMTTCSGQMEIRGTLDLTTIPGA